MTTPRRPILRYHGGKWRLATWIIAHFPRHRVYSECYGGGASVLLRKPRSYAEVYNDLDGEVVNVFRVMRDRPRELVRAVAWTAYARDEYRLAFELAEDPLEQARRTIVRSFMGFGSNSIQRSVKSGFRANANRNGTTPAHDWANYPSHARVIARRLFGVTIEHRAAAEVIAQQDGPETLHYVDPPYVHTTRSTPGKGYAHEMTDEQHVTLADQLHQVKGMVVLSGYHSTLYDGLYRGWQRVERAARGDGACERTEVLWINDRAARRMDAEREQPALDFTTTTPATMPA